MKNPNIFMCQGRFLWETMKFQGKIYLKPEESPVDTLEEESISWRKFKRFHTLKFLAAKIIVYIKIWVFAQ